MVHIYDDSSEIEPKEQFLLFDLYKSFDKIKSSHKSEFFSSKRLIFLYAGATCSELPSNISTMGCFVCREMQIKKIVAKFG